MKKAILFAAFALIGMFGWIYFATPNSLAFGALQDPNSTANKVWLWIAGYVVTLVGVASGAGYRNLQKRQSPTIGSVREFISTIFLSTDFWMGLLGSPIVYGLILKSTERMSGAAFFVTALENGFCCTILINSLNPQSATAPPPPLPAVGEKT